MAKRGGRLVRILPSKPKNDNASGASLRSPSQYQLNGSVSETVGAFSSRPLMAETQMTTNEKQQEILDSSGKSDATSVKTIPENRMKKCEKCARILGLATRCVGCAAADTAHAQGAPGSRFNAIDLELTESATSTSVPAQKKPQNELNFDESSRQVVANVLKRPAQDDNLFISHKKPKISTLPTTLQTSAEKLFAHIRGLRPPSAKSSLFQNELEVRNEVDSRTGPIVSNMAGDSVSTQRHSPRHHNVNEASSDGGNCQILWPDQVTDQSAQAPSTRSGTLAKVGPPQSGAIPNMLSQDPPPLISASKSPSLIGEEGAQEHGRPQASREPNTLGIESDQKMYHQQTTPAMLIDDNHRHENIMSAEKDRVNSSAKSAEANISLSTSEIVELIPTPTNEKASSSALKARCESCRMAHRKCLHRPGGGNDRLDPVKCATFLAENPERPVSGKFPQTYWLKIKQAAGLLHQSTDSSSASQPRENAREATDGLSMTGRDESMMGGIAPVAAEKTPADQQTSKVGLTQNLPFDPPRLRSRTRAAAIEDYLSNSEADCDETLPIGLTRQRNQSEKNQEPLEHAALLAAPTLGGSNEGSDHPHTITRRATGNQRRRIQQDKLQSFWTDDDEQRALENLRKRGVQIETDSDSDESFSDDDTPLQPPPLITDRLHCIPESRNPFDVDSSLDLRNPENRYQALGKIPPWKRNRPTKKQLMGNLLLYQCRDNKLKFGNPHHNVMRKSGEVPVIAIIETDHISNTPDASGREPESQRIHMNFREFIGMPNQAIIAQGKSKDELVFVESVNDKDHSLVGISRARRHRDDEVFPFIHS